jgi:2-polyprenyl-6-hydroxyphenyl methylase/3-demethylubiquinone-9 3-methyltransferase
MEALEAISGYQYADDQFNESHAYLLPKVLQILHEKQGSLKGQRLFDVGCGNGSVADYISKQGYAVVGVDASTEAIEIAHKNYPQLQLHSGSAYDDLAQKYGKFDVALSLEVVEHVYNPRKYAATVYDLLVDGGFAIISTPYHGYWKNLAMALSGKLDRHFTALWDHGHIKFWSIRTLTILLKEAGFRTIEFHRVGRLPFVAKSMIAVARR